MLFYINDTSVSMFYSKYDLLEHLSRKQYWRVRVHPDKNHTQKTMNLNQLKHVLSKVFAYLQNCNEIVMKVKKKKTFKLTIMILYLFACA